jgi:micrococcal nuclease
VQPLVLPVALVLLLVACGGGDDESPTRARVARVIDGDTIALADGRRVRLVQIDAPEEEDGECYADDATTALERLLPPGTPVRLEADGRLDDVDRYGRLLRYAHRESLNVNLVLVERGAAGVWFFDGERGRYADELLAAAREARAKRRGLWRACPAARLDPERPISSG